jgi:hypothetical protein
MENNIRPKVDACRGNQAVFHVAFARDESDESVQEEDFCQ